MEIQKLTINEIEVRISKITDRADTLDRILSDMADVKARASLQRHVNHYRNLLTELNSELETRNKLAPDS